MRVGIVILVAATAWAESRYEVSTIKPTPGNSVTSFTQRQPGGRFVAEGVPLRILIQEAYNVRPFQIVGGPSWIASERWDISAKAEGLEKMLTADEGRPLLRGLLEERFQLRVRRETREMPIYALVVAKGGAKLTPTASERGPLVRIGQGRLTATKARVVELLPYLSQTLGRVVVDKTELMGEYDMALTWTPDLGPAEVGEGASIFTAIQEQLGLRLESQKGAVEVLVIDGVERPGEN